MTIPQRPLGSQGLVTSAQGLGCMGMSAFYGETNEAESLATIDRALELGCNFLDTADVYGPFTNEELVGKAMRGRRDEVVLATKFGIVRRSDVSEGDETGEIQPFLATRTANGRPEYVRTACDASLERLGIDHIDLYYQHRVDAKTPIEETVGAMGELVEAGKVRFLGLSEPGPETIKRAHATHPITAVQNEWSLWSRDLEADVLGVCRDLGIGIVAYSPLGRGFLTGAIKSPDDFALDDFRRTQPRFQGDNFAKNLDLVEKIREMADGKGCTAGQLALAWVHAQGEDVFPIPGTKRRKYLEENIAAFDIALSDDELAALDEIVPAVSGDRYPDMRWVRIESAPASGT
jgi:aryl-alcohol dehydrogenase-like predicted oxidoreductase